MRANRGDHLLGDEALLVLHHGLLDSFVCLFVSLVGICQLQVSFHMFM